MCISDCCRSCVCVNLVGTCALLRDRARRAALVIIVGSRIELYLLNKKANAGNGTASRLLEKRPQAIFLALVTCCAHDRQSEGCKARE